MSTTTTSDYSITHQVSQFELAGLLACWERASHLALQVCCRKTIFRCFVISFLSRLVSNFMLGLQIKLHGFHVLLFFFQYRLHLLKYSADLPREFYVCLFCFFFVCFIIISCSVFMIRVIILYLSLTYDFNCYIHQENMSV